MIPLAWLLLSLLIGHLGRHTALGFLGFFLLSLVFSPLIGALVVAMTRDVPRRV